ncbi:MAG: class I SAM-dependent methyltransferase [Saprospiraceae bacterium]|nr:class I SAM-dependent methyltransferase [Saprospiraceae bacterium]
MNDHLSKVINCIKDANLKGALMRREDVLTGFSGHALYGTLQRLSKEILTKETCYLEIGVFQGLTLLSTAMTSPEHEFFGIDNFAFFDPDKKNKQLIEERAKKLDITNIQLINKDYEDALENLSTYIGNKKVAIYFVDGPHDYRSQLMCLLLIKPFLAENAVILVDDSNYRHVRQANRDFLITHPEFKLLYQAYTEAHPANLSEAKKEKVVQGWWNGINIIYRDKNNELDAFYPETIRDRSLYENEHILQAIRYPEHLHLMWRIFYKFRLIELLKFIKKPKAIFQGKYASGNTYSEGLTEGEFNKTVQAS